MAPHDLIVFFILTPNPHSEIKMEFQRNCKTPGYFNV